MTGVKSPSLLVVSLFAALAATGCASSKFKYDKDAYRLGVMVKDEKCHDASVLLAVNENRMQEIASQAVVTLDATVTNSGYRNLQAQRKGNPGFTLPLLSIGMIPFASVDIVEGSGGERLAVEWTQIGVSETFVTATATKGYEKQSPKGWACELVATMIDLARPSGRREPAPSSPRSTDPVRRPVSPAGAAGEAPVDAKPSHAVEPERSNPVNESVRRPVRPAGAEEDLREEAKKDEAVKKREAEFEEWKKSQQKKE